MELYNCESKEELELKELDITILTNSELVNEADKIKNLFNDYILQDEKIVVEALMQIISELEKRI